MRNIITCIDAWLPELCEKGHPITSFATGEIATHDMKGDIIDFKKEEKLLEMNFLEDLHRIIQN